MNAEQDIEVGMWPEPATSGQKVGMPKGVKVTHKPTGIIVICDTERSQHANRQKALDFIARALEQREGSEIVGHKTFDNGRGGFRHEPLTRAEADVLIAHCKSEDERRKALMPDERSAIRMMRDAHTRLTDMGWKDPIYCPKDGSTFEVIEPGSTGIHKCIYMGEWPKGSWWALDNGDMYPSRPVLFRLLVAAPEPNKENEQ